MCRERFSTSAGPADFPGALVQLTLSPTVGRGRNPQFLIEHVDYPNQASLHRKMLPKLVSVLNLFILFNRFSIATRVNEASLIETVPADQARQDYILSRELRKACSSRRPGRMHYYNIVTCSVDYGAASELVLQRRRIFQYLLPPRYLL